MLPWMAVAFTHSSERLHNGLLQRHIQYGGGRVGKKGKRKVLLDLSQVLLVVGRHLIVTHSNRCASSHPHTTAVLIPWLAFAADILAKV